jgi:hypothetical protein
MKILHTLFFFLLLCSVLTGQIRERGLYINGGVQTGECLFCPSGPHLSIEYRIEPWRKVHIGIGLNHTLSASGLNQGFIQGFGQYKYLVLAKEEPYAFATDADQARLLQTGIWPKRDRFNKLSSLKGEINLYYDLIRYKRHRLEVGVGANVYYFSDFGESGIYSGDLILENSTKVRKNLFYIVPYEHRAFGIGWSYNAAYTYEFARGLSVGLVAGHQELSQVNGGWFNSATIRLGKRWGHIVAQKDSKQKEHELRVGAQIGYSSISPESPGIGLSAGVGFSLNSEWQIELGAGTLWAENDGGFRNKERLPVFIDNDDFVNPLNNNGRPELITGAGRFKTTYNRYYIGTLSLSAGRKVWHNDRSNIQADLGVGLNQVELIHMDYLLKGTWALSLNSKFDTHLPIYRHQRFLDLGAIGGVSYTRQLRGPWTFSARGSAQYMPVSAVFQGGLTAGIGVRF